MFNRKLFLLPLLAFIFILSATGSSASYKAVEGILDLTNWQLDEPIGLDGQWEFYSSRLLEPGDLRGTIRKSGYIDIPCSWNRAEFNGKNLTGDGFATYRLRIKIRENRRLGLKIPRIFTSYKLWVNGELIASAGVVGKSRRASLAQYLPQVAFFEAQQGENEIVIQVSNFYHRSGGILESIIIGSEKQILDKRYRSIAFELFLFGSLMIIGIYHLALFLFRKKDYSPLYFGLFCIFVGMRTALVGERFFIYLFPNFSWEVAHKMQTLTFYLGVPLILIFFHSLFPADFSQKLVRIVRTIALAFAGVVLFTPAKIFTVINPLYQVFAILVIVYIVFVFVKKLKCRDQGIGFIVLGAFALIITSLNDIFFLSIVLNDHSSSFLRSLVKTGYLSSVGQLIFVFAQSLALAQKFSHAFKNEEIITAQLKEMNINLDKLVIKRTEDLEKSRKQIEEQKAELEKTNRTLQHLSLKDHVTNLWNRRQFDETMQVEWQHALRKKKPISLLILDIDYFKEYNDCYGHRAGDKCLKQVAWALEDAFGQTQNLVVRYGGDEFAVIMGEVGKDDAMKIALSLREAIEALKIPHKCSKGGRSVTVSIGVATKIPDFDSSPKELFQAADRALYQAKASGRNQVRFLSV